VRWNTDAQAWEATWQAETNDDGQPGVFEGVTRFSSNEARNVIRNRIIGDAKAHYNTTENAGFTGNTPVKLFGGL
jgi:hypothetical protein